MDIRFYVDLPPYMTTNTYLIATNTPSEYKLAPDWKRVSFVVDFPKGLMKTHDIEVSDSQATLMEVSF